MGRYREYLQGLQWTLLLAALGICDRPCSETEECLEVDGKYQCTCKAGFARLGDVCLGI